jgi:hypothetical protein
MDNSEEKNLIEALIKSVNSLTYSVIELTAAVEDLQTNKDSESNE